MIEFTWRELLVEADIHFGTTPSGGPDPDSIEDVRIYNGGVQLPPWLEEYIAKKYSEELFETAEEAARE